MAAAGELAEGEDAPWNEYRLLVVSRLEELSRGLALVNEKLDRMGSEQTVLKVQMALIGAAAGTVMGAIAALVVGLILRAAGK